MDFDCIDHDNMGIACLSSGLTQKVDGRSLQYLPNELLVEVMKSMAFPTLGNLTIAWPAAEGVVRKFEHEIFRAIVDSHDSPTITRLMTAVMVVRSHRPAILHDSYVDKLIKMLYDDTTNFSQLKRSGQDVVLMLQDLSSIHDSIELIVQYFA